MDGSNVTVFDLPNEILVYIFQYLSSDVHVNLYSTCTKFRTVLDTECILKRGFVFSLDYSLTQKNIGEFIRREQGVCSKVTVLSLNDYYWLESSFILQCSRYFKNLGELHVGRTKLTFGCLVKILEMRSLKKLTMSCPGTLSENLWKKYQVLLQKRLPTLTYLHVYVSQITDINFIMKFLLYCSNLQELWITNIADDNSAAVSDRYYCMKSLHTLVIHGRYAHFKAIIQPILSGAVTGPDVGQKMKNLWMLPQYDEYLNIDEFLNTVTVQMKREDLEQMESIVKTDSADWLQHAVNLNWKQSYISCKHSTPGIMDNILRSAPCLETLWLKAVDSVVMFIPPIHNTIRELNLTDVRKGGHSHSSILSEIAFQRMPNLRKLALPVYALAEDVSEKQTSVYSTQGERLPNKTVRVSLTVNFNDLKPPLDMLRTHCKDIEVLQVGNTGPDCHSQTQECCSKDLQCITKSLCLVPLWCKLKKLVLCHVPFVDSSFLPEITRNCQDLQSLQLNDVGLKGNCVYMKELCEALKNCRMLKDFRMEECYTQSLDRLLEALQSCCCIERVTIISKCNTGGFRLTSVNSLVTAATKLIFFCAFVNSITVRDCKAYVKALSNKYKPIRPAFCCKITNKTHPSNFELKDIPEVHLMEAVHLQSEVANGPRPLYC